MTAMSSTPPTRPLKTKRQLLWERWMRLKTERESWLAHWREISRALLPRNGRFLDDDTNRGEKRHNAIYDNTATRALSTAAAGMMAGATSPARRWFRLTTPDPELNKFHSVRVWLEDVTLRMERVYRKSNTYPTFHQCYREMLAFGTAATIQLPHPTRVVHHAPCTIGEYAIALDEDQNVNTLYRQVKRTVAQVVREFGIENVSDTTRQRYERNDLDGWVDIVHAIEPREAPSGYGNTGMPWRSCYFELTPKENDKLLRESGFKRFRAQVPRWDVAGGDVYGSGPGMMVLGDVNQLQLEQILKTRGLEQQSNPAVVAPTSAKFSDMDLLPGGISFIDSVHPQGAVRNAMDVSSMNLRDVREDILDIRHRIEEGLYASFFLMLHAGRYDPQKTAYEVAELQEEKLIVLGPMLERLHADLLAPDIDAKFDSMLEAGLIPPPPPEMYDVDLQVEFVSMLAQAQRKIGANDIDRFTGTLGTIAGLPGKEDVTDNFDADQWARVYADITGVDPNLIVAGDKVAIVRQARAKAKAAAESTQIAATQAAAARDLAAAPTGGGERTALTDLMSSLSGYSSPPASMV